jgi:1-acyl-sn-glycerol-3-phosphate acyltransferase
MRKLLAYPLNILFFLCFGLLLVIFHPIQWFCHKVLGYDAHKRSVSLLNLGIMGCTMLLGTRYTFINCHKIPTNKPLILVSNHQSMFDIPPIVWYMRKHHPKFVSKIELGKGIPSVSYNLRHGGSVLINRKDSKQALVEITKLGRYIEAYNRTAVIFPEGTRSRTGVPKKFQPLGLKILIRNAPGAMLAGISINNSWKLMRWGKFPYGICQHITLEVHEPLVNQGDADSLIERLEEQIKNGIKVNG